MTYVLSAKGATLLEDLPPELADDPYVQQIVDVLARELQRLEDSGYGLLSKLFPANADDTYLTLQMWEAMLKLPVAPAGATVEQRRATVAATVQMRRAASGADWVTLITLALGTNNWTHQEGPADYNITLRIPYVAGGYQAGVLGQVARRVTPAHLQVNYGFTSGFLIGISNIGDVL